MNFALLLLHITLIGALTLIALRVGKELMIAWLSLLAVAMNVFVLKQITLFGLAVTTSDALAVGYLLGLNLIQEYYGREVAKSTIWISLFISVTFIVLAQLALAYRPNIHDTAQPHFVYLFRPMLRTVFASVVSFLVVQFVDINIFGLLRQKLRSRFFTARALFTLLCAQALDTVLYAFLGLYGLVAEIGHLILMCFIMKGVVVLLSIPFITLSKKVIARVQEPV